MGGFLGGGNIGSIVAVLTVGGILSFSMPLLTRKTKAGGWLMGGMVASAAMGIALYLLNFPPTQWHYLELDGLGRFILQVALSLGIVVAVYSVRYMRESHGAGRYYGLLMMMIIGVVGVVAAKDTIGLYLYFELMSLSSYSLVSFRKDQKVPVEAGLKYVFLNATGSTLAVLGIALAYVYTGSTSLGSVGWGLRSSQYLLSPGILALCLTVAGFGVKAAMVPFHTWLPDAYSYAPAGVSAMLSGIVTEMGFIAMLRLVLGEFSQASGVFGVILLIMGLIGMTIGNLGALGQKDIKRLFSYSSIAQMGYMMVGMGIGLGLGVEDGVRGSLFHIMTNSVMKAGAFLAAGLLIDAVGSRDIDDMKGQGHKYPVLGAVLTLSSLSLAGIPGFAGFMSKWWIYRAGFESGTTLGSLASVITILNSVISLGYYLPLIFTLYRKTGIESQVAGSKVFDVKIPAATGSGSSLVPKLSLVLPWEMVPCLVLGVAVLVLGIYPVPALTALESATTATLALLGGL